MRFRSDQTYADPRTRTEKPCPTCGLVKSLAEFDRNRARADGRQSHCKECLLVMRRTTQRSSDLRRRWGITAYHYNKILSKQGNQCAICGRDYDAKPGDWHVDHCHNTGRIRGILCAQCNKGLGHFGDDPDMMIEAAFYLVDGVE